MSHTSKSAARCTYDRLGGSGCRLLLVILATCLGLALVVVAPALALSEGRVYEQVSPVYKGGYGATGIEAVSPDGDSVAYFSPGTFEGAPSGPTYVGYVAHRQAQGWSTLPLMPPATLIPYVFGEDISSSMDSMLALGKAGPAEEAAHTEGTQMEFVLHSMSSLDILGEWTVAGMPLETLDKQPPFLLYRGANTNFCHILFNSVDTAKPLLEEAEGANDPIYELSRGCEGEPTALRLVDVNNAGSVVNARCTANVGIEGYESNDIQADGSTHIKTAFNAISAPGDEVFFTQNVENKTGCGGLAKGLHQVFVRLDGSRTIEVSKPVSEAITCGEAIPCPGASVRASSNFVGASEDGSRVFFTTTARLDETTDKDQTNDLYMASIGCPESEPGCPVSKREVTSLVQASLDPNAGEAAEVQGVVRIAPDGSHAYFVARGVLSGPNGEGKAPVKGADNLYAYNSASGTVGFVAELCSGPGLSGPSTAVAGPVEDLRCASPTGTDTGLWMTSSGEAQTGGSHGQFLVFSSYGQLVENDTDAAKDVYRYDAQTGSLDRVSLGEEGADANGNNNLFDATIAAGYWGEDVKRQYEMGNRAISEDGSRIVFSTVEPLSAAAIDHLENVYEWHQLADGEDRVSMISSGSALEPDGRPVISPEGNDIFFVTGQGLVGQDVDGAPDIYDARIGGGFPPPPVAEEPCSGDACQGPLSNPAPLLVPGSAVQAPGGNFAAPVSRPVVKAKGAKPSRKKAKRKRKGKGKGKASRRSGMAFKQGGRRGR